MIAAPTNTTWLLVTSVLRLQLSLLRLGVAEARLSTVSFGEEKPLVAGAKSEEDHAKNRRGHCEVKQVYWLLPGS